MERYLREPINGITHFIGAILSAIALIFMIIKVCILGVSAACMTPILIFGISMILLYSTSSLYHSIISTDKVIRGLRRMDHSMIYILITGSYAPFCLIGLKNQGGLFLFILIGFLSLLGIIFKMVWFGCPSWLGSLIYIGLGWVAAFLIKPLWHAIPHMGVIYLILGGVMYTIGGIIYGLKPTWMKIGKFGHHEIFHIFIMFGTLCHFISVFLYLV